MKAVSSIGRECIIFFGNFGEVRSTCGPGLLWACLILWIGP